MKLKRGSLVAIEIEDFDSTEYKSMLMEYELKLTSNNHGSKMMLYRFTNNSTKVYVEW